MASGVVYRWTLSLVKEVALGISQPCLQPEGYHRMSPKLSAVILTFSST